MLQAIRQPMLKKARTDAMILANGTLGNLHQYEIQTIWDATSNQLHDKHAHSQVYELRNSYYIHLNNTNYKFV